MHKRNLLRFFIGSAFVGWGTASWVSSAQDKLEIGADQWKAKLTPEEYRVLFNKGTEKPYSSPLLKEKREGTYVCKACNNPLFEASYKYESGTGWPSFFKAIDNSIGTSEDYLLIVPRTEYHCNNCGGHQGHVFKDGPKPTGLRYCNNGIALNFFAKGTKIPSLVFSKKVGEV